ncbi:MAG: dienelactone hydrolase family protein [Gemmatimonadota bacterium]|nr:dienelactone hydrolase family protein [Gemmatimonadota bacterium]MDH5760386.1 dienelactone hydrolase family protein [Gemmatimonadota bacterium]
MKPTTLSFVVTYVTLALTTACGPAEPAGSGQPEMTAAPEQGMSGPRVASAPTAGGELPPAIVGEGGDLQGVALQYVDGDTLTTGYLAVPEGAGPFPALVIIHEWNGLSDRVRQMADDFAAEGYVTLAADLFDGRMGTTPEENRALTAGVNGDPEKMIANLDAAVAYLRSRSDVTGKVGAMGWCFGGGVALSFGLDGEHHEATAIFYGRLLDDPEVLAGLDHEVYGTFARLDQGIPPEQVEDFEEALRAAGIPNDLHVYDEVGHGFWLRVDQDAEGRTAPALDAWERLKDYLERTLGG